MRWILMMLCMGALTAAHAGKIYKWTDKDGNVHFSDRPGNKAAKSISIKTQRLSPSGGSPLRRYRQRRILRVLREDRIRRQRDREKAGHRQRVMEARCRYYRAKIANFRNAAYIYDRDKSGKKRIYSHDERKRYMQDLQAATHKWCNR